ncbi:plectin isoform 1hij [Pimephales promelas]|nr:plectin isoform 1hij [Pimephales promelas]
MNKILSDPDDDTKGFFDPNTQENLTYLQLVERCVKDPITGLSLLVIVKKGEYYFFIDEHTKNILKSATTNKAGGKFQGQLVTLWDLLYSNYISEEKRRELVQQFKSGTITIEQFLEIVLTLVSQKSGTTTHTITTTTTATTETTQNNTFQGIRKDVSADELLLSKVIDEKMYKDLTTGKVTVDHVSEIDSVRKYLKGTNCIAGVFVQSTKQTMSITEAKNKGLLTPGTSLVLLEAQAATGFMIDPVKNKKLSVEQAVTEGIVGTEWKSKLLSAERAVTGYTDPNTGKTISLFQALKKDLIVKDHGIRLLEAQIATGGIIDPVHSHRVPVEVAYQRGYFDEEMNKVLSDPDDDTKGFFDPNTQENLTYLQLVERCVKDPITGLSLLVIVKKGEYYFFIDEHTKNILKSATTNKAGGKFQGQLVTLWDLLYSNYISEEKRRELVQQFKSGTITIEQFLEIVLTLVSQKSGTSTHTITTTTTATTETTQNNTFQGIRKDVSADELLLSKVIDEKMYKDLTTGKVTVDHVSEIDSVRKYLKGTNCIAGVFVQSTKQTMSITEAKNKGLLTPGTSLVLLEAQAATGFMIDPVKNKKLSVEQAVTEGIVGTEWKNKMLSAERAVTGYTDPNTGKTISLFQALKKDLIVKDHGIRLLEAQIATGGIIDPVHSHRVPVEVAYQRGYFDEEMNKILSDPDDDTKGFFDPNTQENLTYLQLVERCVKDPITGLSLLVIVKKGEYYFFIDEYTKNILKSATTNKAGGKFQGQLVTLWDLLYSNYISEEKRRELVQQFKSGTITIEQFLEIVLTLVSQKSGTSTHTITTTTTATTETTQNNTFQGIRKDVSADELLLSKVIDEKMYKDLTTGKVTVDHVSEIDSVRKYLKGTNCIAGVFVQSTKQTMSITEAKNKGLLTPGTSLVLLEAQAATGFMIDPVKNKKLSVEQAVTEGIVGTEWKSKLLSAERAVTGYTDPNTGKTISLFQALKKDLIVKDHGIRLLEAQIATGGIIDPVHSHRVPVEVAYQRGYFDEEMNKVLSDPDDDTKGFFDPNTQENLTYLQLVERCVKDPITGLSLLVIVKKGEYYFFIDEHTKNILKSATTNKAGGKFQGQLVTLWDLLYSNYISEEKRRELVQQFKSGTITIEQFLEIVLTLVSQKSGTSTHTITTTTTATTETTQNNTFQGIRKDVSADELLLSKVIDEKMYKDLTTGKVTVDHVSEIDSVRKYLKGTNCIAGVFVQSTKQTMSITEAKNKGLLTPGTSLVLLEAQAATGFMIDPVKNKKLSVEQAVTEGIVGTEWKSKLLSAERAVTGYTDPNTGKTISLFQALKKDLIVKDHGIRLLEAQIATGGIIDPVHSHRVPVEVAYQRGYFDEELNKVLSDPDDDTKGFFDPNTQENLTYLQLVERCVKDPITGLSLLVIVKKGEYYFFIDEHTKNILKSATTNKAGGKFQGQLVTLWDLLYSNYISEEKRRELVLQFKSGTITIEQFLEIVLTLVSQKSGTSTHTITTTTTATTETTQNNTFQGIRKDVSADELLLSKVIDEKMYKDLTTGKVTVDHVSEIDSVRKYLKGTNCIAGVFVQSTKQTMSITEAKNKGLLTPGTSLVLLEAQAATGFMIDPVKNKKLSVEQAVTEGIVGTEWKSKLLSAERAVTGYTDPNTGKTISLFQALKKDLIVKDHGIRLLEAQIATGGIIDPVHSHRVPVEVAYQRGYFDEEMNKVLSDPDDDTKGFFDPNTQENLTYLQLVERCVKDPITGLSLLVIVKKGEYYFFIDEYTKNILKSATTNKAGGKFQGQLVTLWDLLYSNYISEEKRRELVQQFKSGTITIEQFLEIVLTLVSQKSGTSTHTITTTTTATTETTQNNTFQGIRKDVSADELLLSKVIDEKMYKDLTTGKVTVDHVSEIDSVRKYLKGTNCIAGVFVQSTKQTMSITEAKNKGLLTPGTSLVLLEAQAATGFMIDPVKNKKLSVEQAVTEGIVGTEWKSKLLSAERAVTGYTDPNTGKTISLFQALKKDLIVKDHGIRLLEAQIATGGIIDPVHSHRVPVEVAYQRGYFDEEMNKVLSDPDDDTKGFFDPNTQENLTYLQLVERCVKDPITGLSLLVIVKKGEYYFFIDEHTKNILKSATTNKAGGKFQGQLVTLWDLLYSNYISEEKRRELVQQFKSGTITIEQFLEIVLTLVSQKSGTSTHTITTTTTATTETTQNNTFQGIRKDVSADELLLSKVIDEKMYKDLTTGKVTVDHVSEIDSVRKYLKGTNCIAGVFVQSTKQTMSITEAKNKGLLTPGTSLVLLEAQAATGFMIDPVKNKKLSVEQAVTEGIVGTEWKNKMLSAERAVTGYTDPNTGKTISLFQALKKDLIVKDHGIRLLEAQIATGGIIDPVHSHRVPVEVAYQRGYFDEEMNKVLSDPDDDTKGFFDPNTQENLTYLQLVERCVKDPITGLSLLVIVKKGEYYFFIDEYTKNILKSATTNKAGGKFQGQLVTLWDLLYSNYISEEKRRELVQQFKSGTITIEQFLEIVLTLVSQKSGTSTHTITTTTTATTETTQNNTFQGIRKDVSADELLLSKVIDEKMYKDLTTGKVTVDHVSEIDSVRKYLKGTNCIAGVFVQSTKQTMSITEAKNKGLLTPGTSLVLLEAQAATGFMIDPVKNKKLSVEQAVTEGIVGTEWKSKLLSAERAVTGYTDPNTGKTISLFQALKKDLIVKDHGIRLLEAQIATGGIIDPVHSHRVPVEVAYQRGYFDEEMNKVLSDPDDDTKGFFDPNTQENLTYLQLVERCVKDPITGLSLLVIVKKGEYYFFIDEYTKNILKSATTNKAGGKFQGQLVTLWDLLYSNYISEEKRRELVQQFKSGTITIEQFLEIVLTLVSQKSGTSTHTITTTTTATTETTQNNTFQGIRKDVSADELLLSKVIDEKMYKDLTTGKVTVDHVSEIDSVRKYLKGTNCIAGVFVQSTKQTMSITEAKNKGLLTPGTSLVLLEAQAATGFMIDPVKNKKLSVEQAVTEGIVGTEWKSKLLSAERAVTGYTDPNTGKTISLFQALKKDLIVKDHGIRLLEAQIATGGIIDPVHSHRVPVEVAYQRGYFDEEMNKILSDPDDDTKGFFDPNTQENLTYLQLVERCVKDPITGLSLLVIVKKGEYYFFIDEHTKNILKSATTNKAGGKFQGQLVTLWDLLYSNYISEEKRRELVQQFKSGTITIEQFLEIVLTLVSQKSGTSTHTITTTTTATTETTQNNTFQGIRKDVSADELLLSKVIDEKMYKDLTTGKVTVDHVSEIDSVRKYLKGTNCIAGVFVQSTKQTMSITEAKNKGLLTPGTSLVLLEAQAATGFMIDPVKNKKLSVEQAVTEGIVGTEWKSKLLSAERAVTGYTDPNTGKTISLFQALKKDLIVKDHGIRLLEAQIATGGIIDPVHSHRVPVEVAYQRGYFDEEMNKVLSDPDDDTKGFFDPNTQENLTYLQLVERCVKDPITGLSLLVIVKKGEYYFFIDEYTKNILKSATTNKAGGKFQGQLVTLWDLLYSNYISEEKRRELVQQFKSGTITIEQFLEIVLTLVSQKSGTSTHTITTTTTATTETTQNNTFQGIRKDVSADELLLSKVIDEKMYKDLTTGKVTVDHVSEIDSVRKYLKGTNCIAGVFVQSTKQTMSITEAKNKGLLTPGTSLVLLEAQAATGFMIDPVKNKKLSVEQAVTEGIVGTEWKSKLLSAERAVTGYTDPNTGKTISLFQALKKDLIVKDHGIRLLEAQIATGGIIDPVHSHRVPVEVAYQRGYFDEEMNKILSDPDDDTKGFFDPNTQENLTYLQLVERCVKDPITGLSLLVIVKKGEYYFFIDEHTKNILKSATTNKAGGKFQGQLVTLWDLLYSNYISEEKRRELVQQFKSGTITIEQFLEIVLTLVSQKSGTSTHTITTTTTATTETTQNNTFQGIRKDVSADELLLSKVIDEKMYKDLTTGKVTVDHVSEIDSVRKYLKGTNCIAGVFVQSTKQTMSITEAKNKGLLTPGTSLVLLEAQAATGFMIDPVKNKKLSVEQAVTEGIVGTEWKSKLLSAERAVTGYTDPNTGKTISLFQALKKDLIVKDHGIRLLEAQIATGGIIDPVHSHRVPVEVAYQRGYFDEEMNKILSDPDDDTKGFFDPNTQENLTYLQLVERCVKDPITGLSLLVIVKKGEYYFFIDEHTKNILKSATTNKAGGKFQGQLVTLWDLLYSNYISEEKRRELVQQFKSVIDEKMYKDLTTGKVTVDHVSEIDSVRKYLKGTNCIAGVFVQSTKQTMSITEAKNKRLLTPGTSLVLLEAQAATGFMIDPVKNKKLSVEQAVTEGIVGTEWKSKLLSAERAVTGYTDPNTGKTISLFQALKKDLIVKDHGIRLLEAQIATGGIIDPVHSHRVPVEVAYQRGYFDEEMNKILSDPDDDTKGFFDPNTQENLTYMQLMERCVRDPKTGLSLLALQK